MAQVAADCSQKEQNNDDAYYTASDRLKLRYLDQQLVDGKENLHEGIIAKITSGGMLVDVRDLGIYGFVPLENLPGSFRRYGNVLKMSSGHMSYKCGDYIYLQLSQIDFVRGTAIFRPT